MVRLAGILNDGNVVLFADRQDFIQVGGSAENVDGHDGAGVFCNAVLDVIRVNLERFGIGIRENRQRVTHHHRIGGCDVRVRGENNFVTRPHAQELQGHLEGMGSARRHDTAA